MDPDPADQNETDPNGSGSETLIKIHGSILFILILIFQGNVFSETYMLHIYVEC